MGYCLTFFNAPFILSLSGGRRLTYGHRSGRKVSIVATASGKWSNCEFSGLNTPLEPASATGRFLSGVLQDDFECFRVAAVEELRKLAAASDEAVVRLRFGFGSDEATLHRRIAELKERECRAAIEDVMYMLVLYKFKDISVHLVPRLSRCMYNGRLEIWPSKDWELESIHSFEVLQMVKEHLTAIIGWKADSNVTANWALTKITRSHLYCIYASSLSYGYFLKSASLRHCLDLSLCLTCHNPIPVSQPCSSGLNDLPLRYYILEFDPVMLQICSKLKTKEARNLIEKHICALFGYEKKGLGEMNEVITTSLSSLKRMVLEAIAFGSFIWETEEFVSSVYKLEEN